MHCGERVREREWGGLGWEAEEDRGPERKRRRGSSISRRRRRVIARHLLITDNCRSGKLRVFALSGSQHHAHVSVPSLCRGVCASCCGFILLGENSCCFTQWSFFFSWALIMFYWLLSLRWKNVFWLHERSVLLCQTHLNWQLVWYGSVQGFPQPCLCSLQSSHSAVREGRWGYPCHDCDQGVASLVLC